MLIINIKQKTQAANAQDINSIKPARGLLQGHGPEGDCCTATARNSTTEESRTSQRCSILINSIKKTSSEGSVQKFLICLWII